MLTLHFVSLAGLDNTMVILDDFCLGAQSKEQAETAFRSLESILISYHWDINYTKSKPIADTKIIFNGYYLNFDSKLPIFHTEERINNMRSITEDIEVGQFWFIHFPIQSTRGNITRIPSPTSIITIHTDALTCR
jgi:hypothetical protein